ncbi:MAG: Fe-only nitrogenase accessory protein AnfO [Deferribacterales bacterium]
MRLAAYVDPENIITGLKQKGSVRLYDQIEEEWTEVADLSMDVNEAEDLEQLQSILKDTVGMFGGCSVLIAEDMTGVMNAILESVGIKTWRSEGNVYDVLGYIASEEERELLESMAVAPEPVLQGSECAGKYHINLVETLKTYTKLNSREILLPFLMRGGYKSLEIICEHIPRWLESDADKLNVAVHSKTLSKNGIRVVVVPKDGGNSACSSCAPSVPLSSCGGGSMRKGGCCG